MLGFSSTEKDDVVSALLDDLISDFDTGTGTSGRAMRQLLAQEPARFCTAAIQVLMRDENSAASNYLVQLLLAGTLLIETLCDPSAMSLSDAVRLARRTAQSLPILDARLAERIPLTDRGGAAEHREAITTRILEILGFMATSHRILPVLMRLLHGSNPRIHSKAILLLVRSRRDEHWINQVLSHPDWRIRANVIEALWDLRYSWLPAQLRRASQDPHNRVAANALVGLYKLGDPEAADGLRKMLESDNQLARASAAWAMGETGDEQFAPVLREVARGAGGSVRTQTLRALTRIRNVNKAVTQ